MKNFLRSPALELTGLLVETISLPNNIYGVGVSTLLKIVGANFTLAIAARERVSDDVGVTET